MKFRYLIFLGLAGGLAGSPVAQAQKRPVLAPPADAPTQTARTELLLEQSSSEVHVQALAADSTVVLLLGREKPLSGKSTFVFQQYDQALHLRQESTTRSGTKAVSWYCASARTPTRKPTTAARSWKNSSAAFRPTPARASRPPAAKSSCKS